MAGISVEANEVKDATMDAAALLLAITRNDMEGVGVIVNHSNPQTLLSGVIAVAISNLASLTSDNSEEFMTGFVSYLQNLSNEDWNSVAGNTVVIGLNK